MVGGLVAEATVSRCVSAWGARGAGAGLEGLLRTGVLGALATFFGVSLAFIGAACRGAGTLATLGLSAMVIVYELSTEFPFAAATLAG